MNEWRGGANRLPRLYINIVISLLCLSSVLIVEVNLNRFHVALLSSIIAGFGYQFPDLPLVVVAVPPPADTGHSAFRDEQQDAQCTYNGQYRSGESRHRV